MAIVTVSFFLGNVSRTCVRPVDAQRAFATFTRGIDFLPDKFQRSLKCDEERNSRPFFAREILSASMKTFSQLIQEFSQTSIVARAQSLKS